MWYNPILLHVFLSPSNDESQHVTTILNSISESGSTCRRPSLFWKYESIYSFTFIPTFPPLVNASIHFHQVLEKPFILKVCCKKPHFTLSYTFSKINLENNTILLFFLCVIHVKSHVRYHLLYFFTEEQFVKVS